MYTTGSEFDYEIDGNIEYFTCIGETVYSGIEYLICESEDGMKKVFFYEEEFSPARNKIIKYSGDKTNLWTFPTPIADNHKKVCN